MRVASGGHAVFGATLIALGILGLFRGELTPIWLPVPESVPARAALAYLCSLISLGCGIGLLWRRTTAAASRVLLAYLLLWLLVFRVPFLFIETPVLLVAWSCGSTAVMVAGAWVLY